MFSSNLPTMLRNNTSNVSSLSNWMDRVFDDMVNRNSGTFVPTLNVSETDKTFEITVALPGMNRDDVEIYFENGMLTISGERRWQHDDDKENGRRYHRVEAGYGTFSRTLPLPNVVDADNITAEFQNGELIITVPKLKEKAGKKIKVK
jgi:HSP20 family protein